MGKKKSQRINLIICAVAFVVMIVVMLFVDKPENLLNAFLAVNPVYFVAAVALILLYWFFEGAGLHAVMKAVHKKQKFKNSMSVSMIGQYFNCITPFASGGQPIQAYYLVKFGAPLSSALTALLSKFIAYQFVLTLYCTVLLIIRGGAINNTAMVVLVMIGFAVNAAVIVGLLTLAFFQKAAKKVSHFFVKLLGKIHVIKDVDAKIEYIDKEMELYIENFKFIKSRPWLVIRLFLLSALQLTCYFSITYVIYLGFGLSGADFFTVIAYQAFILLITSFVPIPGALGASEGSYALFFMSIFSTTYLTLSTFVWRFLTFYLAIIIGMTVTLVVNRSSKKNETPIENAQE